MSRPPHRITIIGLGLIGGSLAAACRKKFPHARIIGVTRNRSALVMAKKRGWIHEGFRHCHPWHWQSLCEAAFPRHPEATKWPKDLEILRAFGPQDDAGCSHLVILCTPVDTLKNYLCRLDQIAPPGTIVTDTGSVKSFLVRWAERQKWRRVSFVGAHPMAGSHERGISHARPNLFEGSLTFVTPGRRTSSSALRLVGNFWKRISHRVVVVSPEEHDRFTAEISHLPHLLAALLVDSVSKKALRFAASGFLDTTRIAQGDPALWVPILLENRKTLTKTLSRFKQALKQVEKILGKGETVRLRRLLLRAQGRRSALGNSAE